MPLLAITGVTGLLGRNLLLETIKQNRKKLSELKFVFFGRDSKKDNLKDRIIKILEEELKDYTDDESFDFEQIYGWFEQNVKLINYKLDVPQLGISIKDLEFLKKSKIDFFFHIAALTNLWHDEESKNQLEKANYFGTKYLVELVKELKNVGEFVYVGTAYSCGKTYGEIMPDYVNKGGHFRNNYERVKLEAELLVRDLEKETGQKCRYFRPSVVCGRMIEKPFGAVSKFDVFYGWGVFFAQLKKKYVKNIENFIEEECRINLRYQISFDSGLNIVPVDYCAKIIYHCCFDNSPAKHVHLTYKQEIPHTFYFPLILKSLNIEGVVAVDELPANQNFDEKLYYKSLGKVFNPYMTSQSMLFNIDNIKDIVEKNNIEVPDFLDSANFNILLNYAKKEKYGLN